MKAINQWITWNAGATTPDGKFPKYPTDSKSGKNHNAHDPSIWLSFDDAVTAFEAGQGSGIGFVLTKKPVSTDDRGPLYLVGIDIDDKSGLCCKNADGTLPIKETWLRLGKPYMEVSPSGKGVRMFCLSRVPVKSRNMNGVEVYTDKRYLTVTGNCSKGTLRECTAPLQSLYAEWFGGPTEPNPKEFSAMELCDPLKGATHIPNILGHLLEPHATLETPENLAQLDSMLKVLDPALGYEDWRNVVWGIASTGWDCAEDKAREWSESCPKKYDETVFQKTWNSYKPGGIGYGTLVHMAKNAGWKQDVAQEADSPNKRFNLLKSSDLAALPPLKWLVKGVIPAQGIAAIYGPSGSGKSFLALDMLAAVANGTEWFGHKVVKSPIIYVALEGGAGIKQRIQAWEMKHGQPLPDSFRVLLNPLALSNEHDIHQLAAEIKAQGLGSGIVVIDTLNQAAPDADENTSQDMGLLVKNAKLLQSLINGLVVLVHHTGKDTSRGLRGHSSLLAALDAAIEIVRDKSIRQWQVAKLKDADDGAWGGFSLEIVSLGQDTDGDQISSCIVTRSFLPLPTQVKPPQGKNQRVCLEVIAGLLKDSTSHGMSSAPENRPCIPEGGAIKAVAEALPGTDSKRRNERAKAAIHGLNDAGHVTVSEGWIWIKN
jgi:hypothetical protein